MANNLGIYTARALQQPHIGYRGFARSPLNQALQFANQSRGGFAGGGTSGPSGLFLTVTVTTPQVIIGPSALTPLTGVTLTSPITANFLARYTGTFGIVAPLVDITAAGAAANTALAAQLAGLPGGVPHGAVFGNGETLLPGVYDVVTPAAIQGILTLDGGGDPNARFVFRVAGALTSVAASTVVLTNGATANNVFWRSTGATALGANTIFRGTALAVGGAASIGNASIVNGRLLSTLGAVNTDTSVVSNPGATTTAVVLGPLELFALFSSSGAVANTGASTITGDIGTNLGLITGFGPPTLVVGDIYPPGSLVAGPVSASFAIYKNGVVVPGTLTTVSSPTTIVGGTVNTSATVALVPGDVVTAQATAILGTLTVNSSTLSLQQV